MTPSQRAEVAINEIKDKRHRLRAASRAAIIRAIRERGPMTAFEIRTLTDIHPAENFWSLMRQLMDGGLVARDDSKRFHMTAKS